MKQCFLILAFFLSPLFGIAQSTSATISGGVTDPSGKFILDADVEIANDATGVVYPAKTNSSGMYLVPILPPGHYHVQVSKTGFKTLIKPDIVLNVQSAVALNFTLPLGASSVSITVEGGVSTINTTDGSVSTVIDQKFVENIPLNGRSFQDLISMTPGVVTQSPQAASSLATNGDFSVNGQRTESNYYTVDGVSANISSGPFGGTPSAATGGTIGASTALGTTQSMISVDALQEFRVQSSTYSAEYGRSPGGQFSLLTRSGTNDYHGSAFDYLRNNFFDANDWFNDYFGKPISALRQNDFGGTSGGPVWIPRIYNGKARTFFFVSYEGLRLTQPTAAAIQYVPDLFMRRQAAQAIQPILNAYPIPNGLDYGTSATPSLAQFISPFSLPSSINSTSVRIDHTLSSQLSVFFRYGTTLSSTESRPYFALTTTRINTQTYTLGATDQFTSRLTDDFRLAYDRSDSSQNGVLDSFGGATPLNLADAMGVTSALRPLPVMYFSISGIGSSDMAPYDTSNLGRQWNLVDTLNVLSGHHSLKVGLDFRHIKSPLRPFDVEAFVEFESAQAILTNAPQFPYIYNTLPATPLFNETAIFAQDEWRAAPRMSISFGVRWELDPPPTGADRQDAYTLSGTLSNPSTLTLAPRGTPLWKTTWYDFAPRLGLAWSAHTSQGSETIVRGGGGVFFDSANEDAALGFGQFGFSAYQLVTGGSIPFTPAQLTVPISTAAPYTSGSIFAFPDHLQLPYTIEWNTSIQQGLGKSQTFTISYIGASGRRLLSKQQISLAKFNPDFGTVYIYPARITSNYQALEFQFQRSVARGLHALASYTWSHSIDFGSTATELPLMRGNSDFDVRNNLQGGVSWDLPHVGQRRFTDYLLRDWGIDGRLNVRSAFPVPLNGVTTTDTATGNVYLGGLNIVPGNRLYLYGDAYPGHRILNKAAFALPASGTPGNAPRNTVRGFGATQINLAAQRDFQIRREIMLEFRAEAFNALNHPNFGFIDPTYANATFGRATKMLDASLGTVASQYQQGGPRSLQFALKLKF